MFTIALALGSLSCGTCGLRPFISSISPNSTPAGGNQFLLTVNGSDFRRDSVVSWNGSFPVTSFLSSHQLAAAITGADIAAPGWVLVFRLQSAERQHNIFFRGHRKHIGDGMYRQRLECGCVYDWPVKRTANSRRQQDEHQHLREQCCYSSRAAPPTAWLTVSEGSFLLRALRVIELLDLSAPADGNEKATLVPKSPNPSKLCQPALKMPVVCSCSEQLL